MIDYELKDGIALVTFNNPPMNVLSSNVLKELSETLSKIEKDHSVRCMVLTGAGRAFVAGADISEMSAMDPHAALEFARLGQGVLDRIQHLHVPVIAAVNGFALGGGTEIAIACDIRIASEAAKFGQPEVNLAVIPGFGGTQRLARLIGPGKAKELIFTGDMIDHAMALQVGLVQMVVPGYKKDASGAPLKDEKGKPVQDNAPVVSASMEMARKIAGKGPDAIKMAKKSINEGLDMTLAKGLEIEAKNFSALFATEDQKEGMKAFLDKRKPEFKGK
ncbi:MAG: enoyl-CoA hydratase/isomerase family protein [Euryarchaeota archaeon]|nr:enoyl-CoA hydratase/isomerase family protein [Euryarchaeota archaeon]